MNRRATLYGVEKGDNSQQKEKACGVKTYKNVSKNKSAKRNIFDLMKDKILIGIGITIVIELWAIIRELKSDK